MKPLLTCGSPKINVRNLTDATHFETGALSRDEVRTRVHGFLGHVVPFQGVSIRMAIVRKWRAFAKTKTQTQTQTENGTRRRSEFDLNISSIPSIGPSTMDNVYLQKPPPATIIYAFIGGDPNTQMAKSSRRYNEDLARVNDINFRVNYI